MGDNSSHPELATTKRHCPKCGRLTAVRDRDGTIFHHPTSLVPVGDHPAPYCEGGGLLWGDTTTRLQAPPVMPPHRKGSGCEVLHQMPTELAKSNPRLVRAHMWRGVGYPVQLPGGFFNETATPAGEQLTSYAWLAFVTGELYPFVGSVLAAYRVAKTLHLSRWPEGTPELPAGTLVRRRLEREAGA